MTALKCAAGAIALLAANMTPMHAAEPITGRWAADPSFCAGIGDTPARSPLVVTDQAVRWFGDSCRVGRSYRAGDTLYIEAFCWGAARERVISVTLRKRGERLAVTWDRSLSGDMLRCP